MPFRRMIQRCSVLGISRIFGHTGLPCLYPSSIFRATRFLSVKSISTAYFNYRSWTGNGTDSPKCPSMPVSTFPNSITTRNYAIGSIARDDDEGIFQRLRRRLGFPKTEMKKYILRGSGKLLYVKIADEVNYKKFFQVYNLEDTFASWFIVMELHVWLLSCRLMEEGEDGRVSRNALIKAMWQDVDFRSKKLEGALASARRTQMSELGHEFNTQMFSYDEGLLSSDHVLAGALWRRFLHQQPAKDENDFLRQIVSLEQLLAFTRCQFAHLHKLSKSDVLNCKFKWIELDKSLLDDKQ